jgi:capsular polysaccharide biosynthesis protein
MSDIDRRLPRSVRRRRGRRTIVVIADRERQVTRLRIAQSPWARARVVPMVGSTPAESHEGFAALDQVGLVIDVRASSDRRQLEAFRQHFFHLGSRDAWIALRATGSARTGEPLVELARKLRIPQARRELGRPWRPYARSVARVRITPRLFVIAKKGRHVLRLQEEEAFTLLPNREPGLGVTLITQLDAGVLDTTGLTTEYGGSPEPRVPELLPYPVHSVRRYEGRLHLPAASLVHHRRSVLPDSFRWHLAPQTGSVGLRNVNEHFSRVRARPRAEPLEGSYFLFLYTNPGHFGHLMTEALAKLWGWWPAKAADPSLKILCRLRPERQETVETRAETTLLPAFGIAPEDIVWVDGPVTVTSLVGCTPMWHNAPPFYVNPAIRDTWSRLHDGLVGTGPAGGSSRIFVTRREGNRPCTNVDAVERLFAAHGFTIVAPEHLSIPEQAATFAGARVVAGLGGAGMFNLVYASSVETVIVLNQWAYQARNEHLFAAAHGARLHCFWSTPELDHPPGGFSYGAHQSGWSFDFDRNEKQLRELLENLAD